VLTRLQDFATGLSVKELSLERKSLALVVPSSVRRASQKECARLWKECTVKVIDFAEPGEIILPLEVAPAVLGAAAASLAALDGLPGGEALERPRIHDAALRFFRKLARVRRRSRRPSPRSLTDLWEECLEKLEFRGVVLEGLPPTNLTVPTIGWIDVPDKPEPTYQAYVGESRVVYQDDEVLLPF
jgi:hypothetical protein